MTQQSETINNSGRWLKRLGVAGFLFFFVKGMLWLIIPALIYISSK